MLPFPLFRDFFVNTATLEEAKRMYAGILHTGKLRILLQSQVKVQKQSFMESTITLEVRAYLMN